MTKIISEKDKGAPKGLVRLLVGNIDIIHSHIMTILILPSIYSECHYTVFT